jgi:ent-kaurenoic acid monooxygenase
VYKTFMFSKPTVLVATPDACKRVLMDDDSFAEGWPRATVALIGRKSFLTLPCEEHRRLRKLTAAPINGFDALTTYLGFIDRTVVATLRGWSDAGEIEFLTELRRMTFKIIVQIFLTAADDATTLALESSYTDLNYGMRAMAINLPGFAFHRAFKACPILQAKYNQWRLLLDLKKVDTARVCVILSGSQEAGVGVAGCPEREEGEETAPPVERRHDGPPD